VKVFATTRDAVADLQLIYAMTARQRDLRKDVATPHQAATDIQRRHALGERCGVMFGPERAGLENGDLSFADRIINIPANPGFSSLNLAQAVLLFGYEYFKNADQTPPLQHNDGDSFPATKEDLGHLFDHLEEELRASGFLFPPEKAPTMVRNIRALLQRARLTEQEVRTLRGVISSLSTARVIGQNGD
jgi:tRNA/rRNA methyltransferase